MGPNVTGYTQLQRPLHGLVNGRPVRLFAFADVPGNSPSWQIIDETGKATFVPCERVVIADPEYLPANLTALQNIGTTTR
jgi:hypothetical protein